MGTALVTERGSEWILHFKKLAIYRGVQAYMWRMIRRFSKEMKKLETGNMLKQLIKEERKYFYGPIKILRFDKILYIYIHTHTYMHTYKCMYMCVYQNN